MDKFRQFIAFGLIAASLSSCATILGGPVNEYQRTKPLPGQPQRELRIGALVADVLLVGLLGVAIDFGTGAIYKPRPTMPRGGTTPLPAPVYAPTPPAASPAPAVAPPAAAPAPAPRGN